MAVIQPFDQSRITRHADGIARYDDLASSLITMLRATVDRVSVTRGRLRSRGRADQLLRAVGPFGARRRRIARTRRHGGRPCVDSLGQRPRLVSGVLGSIQMVGAIAVPVKHALRRSLK